MLRTSARPGTSNQTCHICMRPSSDACKSCLKRTCGAHPDSGVERRDECAREKTSGHQDEDDETWRPQN
eukprot:983559-Pyramimonas_sp.AAC.1